MASGPASEVTGLHCFAPDLYSTGLTQWHCYIGSILGVTKLQWYRGLHYSTAIQDLHQAPRHWYTLLHRAYTKALVYSDYKILLVYRVYTKGRHWYIGLTQYQCYTVLTKLEGVEPVDNRPSNRQLHNFF